MEISPLPERVLALGVFDLWHIGHLRYVQFARTCGVFLTVGVLADRDCLETKGRLPIIDQEQRMELIRGLGWVDEVRLMPTSTAEVRRAASWINQWRVEMVVAGGNWKGSQRWQQLEPLLWELGIPVTFAPHTEGVSTSCIVRKIADLMKSHENDKSHLLKEA